MSQFSREWLIVCLIREFGKFCTRNKCGASKQAPNKHIHGTHRIQWSQVSNKKMDHFLWTWSNVWGHFLEMVRTRLVKTTLLQPIVCVAMAAYVDPNIWEPMKRPSEGCFFFFFFFSNPSIHRSVTWHCDTFCNNRMWCEWFEWWRRCSMCIPTPPPLSGDGNMQPPPPATHPPLLFDLICGPTHCSVLVYIVQHPAPSTFLVLIQQIIY